MSANEERIAQFRKMATECPDDELANYRLGSLEVEGLGKLSNRIVEGPAISEEVGAQPTESEEVISTALGGDWEFRGIRTPSKDLYPSTIKESDAHN